MVEAPTSLRRSPDSLACTAAAALVYINTQMLALFRVTRLAGRRRLRLSPRRVAGAVVFALLAHQATAQSWASCDERAVGAMPPAMAAMTHGPHDTATPGTPNAPEPCQGTDCDHTLPASECGLGTVCTVVALPGSAIRAVRQGDTIGEPFIVVIDGPRAPEFAPDPPPPRA